MAWNKPSTSSGGSSGGNTGDSLITTYTHIANKEVIVSSVDIATGTFTSVGHGLANGDRIAPILNQNAGSIFPPNVYTGGLSNPTWPGYYVVNATVNTFQLSTSSGGSAITLTTNANMDLTKWHFEKWVDPITISNLPNLQKFKVVIKGKTLIKGQTAQILINNTTYTWYMTGWGGYADALLEIAGDIYIQAILLIDTKGIMSFEKDVFCVQSSTATANISSSSLKNAVSLGVSNVVTTSIGFKNIYLANGTTVEVYSA